MTVINPDIVQLIIESEPMPDNPSYTKWRITGISESKVQSEAYRLMHGVSGNGHAVFSHPRPIVGGTFKGWFCITGITHDGDSSCP